MKVVGTRGLQSRRLVSRFGRSTCAPTTKRQSEFVGKPKPQHYSSLRAFAGQKITHQSLLDSSLRSKRSMRLAVHAMQSFTIIGDGRVGAALADMGDGSDVVIKRGQSMENALPSGPIIVCTRNDDLDAVVEATPEDRRSDLVFIQNGMLQPWLDAKGLGQNTQVLVYFAVAKKGEAPTDGKTDTNPEGLTAAYGKHAESMASRLHAAGLSCKVLPADAFAQSMLEKLVWICSFMLIGAKYGGCTVGEVESQYKDDVSKLILEIFSAGAKSLGISGNTDGLVERLCAYARSVSHFPTAVKEFPWRNGYFYNLSKQAIGQGSGDPCPFHTGLLEEVGAI